MASTSSLLVDTSPVQEQQQPEEATTTTTTTNLTTNLTTTIPTEPMSSSSAPPTPKAIKPSSDLTMATSQTCIGTRRTMGRFSSSASASDDRASSSSPHSSPGSDNSRLRHKMSRLVSPPRNVSMTTGRPVSDLLLGNTAMRLSPHRRASIQSFDFMSDDAMSSVSSRRANSNKHVTAGSDVSSSISTPHPPLVSRVRLPSSPTSSLPDSLYDDRGRFLPEGGDADDERSSPNDDDDDDSDSRRVDSDDMGPSVTTGVSSASPIVVRLKDAEMRAHVAEAETASLREEVQSLREMMRRLTTGQQLHDGPPHPHHHHHTASAPSSPSRGDAAFGQVLCPSPVTARSLHGNGGGGGVRAFGGLPPRTTPSTIRVDLSVLQENTLKLRRFLTPGSMLCAVLKNNAFGHGIGPVASALASYVDMIGIVDNWEAHAVRHEGLTIDMLRLRPATPDEVQDAPEGLHEVLASYQQAFAYSKAALCAGKVVNVHIMLNLGENRMSYNFPSDLSKIVKSCQLPGLQVVGIMGHFACADDLDTTREMLAEFKRQADAIESELAKATGTSVRLIRHVANTAASVAVRESHLDMVRIGGGLYGQEDNVKPLGLTPALSWRTQVVLIRHVPAGTYIGYGLAYKFERPATVATLPIGYGHGLSKMLSSSSDDWACHGKVLVNGVLCPIVGRVSSAMATVDITDVADVTGTDVRIGDPVIIMGLADADMLSGSAVELGPTAEDHAQLINSSFDQLTSTVLGADMEYTYAGRPVQVSAPPPPPSSAVVPVAHQVSAGASTTSSGSGSGSGSGGGGGGGGGSAPASPGHPAGLYSRSSTPPVFPGGPRPMSGTAPLSSRPPLFPSFSASQARLLRLGTRVALSVDTSDDPSGSGVSVSGSGSGSGSGFFSPVPMTSPLGRKP